MRKLKLQMQMSVDGFVSTGSNDEQKWVTWAWEEIKSDVLKLIDSTDTILIGRKLAEGYIPHWQGVANNPKDPMYDLGKKIHRVRKIVFTKSLIEKEWENTNFNNSDLTTEVKKLKDQKGKDIIVYGGSSFVSSLVKNRLVDQYYLYINPVALGQGESIFNKLSSFYGLELKSSKAFNSGIVLLTYHSKSV